MLYNILSFAILPLLLLAAIIAAVAYGVAALTRGRRRFGEVDTGIGTAKRLYFYGVAFVALMMAASGVVEIVHFVLDSLVSSPLVVASRIRLATGLSLSMVGIPLWAFHWRLISGHVRKLPVETQSIVRKAYVYVVLAVSAGITIGAAMTVVQWLLGNQSFSGYSASAVVLWGGVWAYHWLTEGKEEQPTPETNAVRRLYLYVVTSGMLVVAVLGAALLVGHVLHGAYDSLTDAPLIAGAGLWNETTRMALSFVLVAGPVWAAHWLYFARRDLSSVLRQLYVYGVAILGSTVTLLVALGVTIFQVLVWAIGVPSERAAADHFNFLPSALTSMLAAGAVLAYHAWQGRRRAETSTAESRGFRRTFPYLVALLGLVPLALGIFALATMATEVLFLNGGASLVGSEQWLNSLALAITLGLLGGPLWWYTWLRGQQRVSAGDAAERANPARRRLIFLVLGAAMLAMVVGVSVLIFVFLRELLDGDLSQVVRDARVAIAAILPAAIFLPYYWMVYRADRLELETEPERERPEPKAVTALAGEHDGTFIRQLQAALGYDMDQLEWVDPEAHLPDLSEDGMSDLARRIQEAPGDRVLLVADGATIKVLSYR